jgi:hypothetical protein
MCDKRGNNTHDEAIRRDERQKMEKDMWSLCHNIEKRLNQNSVEGMRQMDSTDVVEMFRVTLNQLKGTDAE